MAEKEKSYPELEQLRGDLKNGSVKNFYVFYGEEIFLRQFYIGELRRELVGNGTEAFNHHVYSGKITCAELEETVNAYPAFAERTLVEVWDWDVFAAPEEERKSFLQMISDLPDYVCLILIFDTTPYKPDKRLKCNSDILKKAILVEYGEQPRDKLIRWIQRRVQRDGLSIDRETAEYLIFTGGSLMTQLDPEIQKLCSYCERSVTKKDIDDIVSPVVEAVVWKLTEALLQGRYGESMETLGKLISVEEAPHRIIAAISSELRRLLTVKIWMEEGRPTGEVKALCGIRFDFQLQKLVSAAKRLSLDWCRNSVLLCSETAYKLNSDRADPEDLIRQFLAEVALQ